MKQKINEIKDVATETIRTSVVYHGAAAFGGLSLASRSRATFSSPALDKGQAGRLMIPTPPSAPPFDSVSIPFPPLL